MNSWGAFKKWIFPKGEDMFSFRMVALRYTFAVGLLWVYVIYLSTLSEYMAVYARRLLDQLNFSRSSVAQFYAIINDSEAIKDWHFWGLMAGLTLWGVFLWLWLLCRLFGSLSIFLNDTNSSWHFELVFGIIFFLSRYEFYEARFHDWDPWISRVPPPSSVSQNLVNSLLKTTSDGQWNPRTYSEVMGPLTRFSLMQRETDSAYSMHVLVRWWARNRLPLVLRQGWAREVERFISMSYSSDNCWLDPLCQQMLIPHLIDVANLGVTTEGYHTYSLRDILSRLCRSLRLVEMSYGP